MTQLIGLPNWSGSDHIPITCEIRINIENEDPLPKKMVVRKGVKDKEIIQAMMNSPWPIMPWNKIPAIRKLLTEVKVPRTQVAITARALEALRTSDTPEDFA